jgi:hypothetical protein
VDRIRRLDPNVIVTVHGPVAHGRSDQLCEMLSGLATMEPLALPNQAALEEMLASMDVPEAQPAPPL